MERLPTGDVRMNIEVHEEESASNKVLTGLEYAVLSAKALADKICGAAPKTHGDSTPRLF